MSLPAEITDGLFAFLGAIIGWFTKWLHTRVTDK